MVDRLEVGEVQSFEGSIEGEDLLSEALELREVGKLETVTGIEGIVLNHFYSFAVDRLEVLELITEDSFPDLLDITGEDEHSIATTTREDIVVLDSFEDAILDYVV